MEERLPPADDSKDDTLPNTSRSGTYVVQVPKDQIYRVPPPENAILADRFRAPPSQKRSCWPCLFCHLISIILVALILVILVGLFYLAVKPKSINFSVERVLGSNQRSHYQHQSQAKFDITLKAENANERMGILYQRGGEALLSFKKQKIATGNPPAFYQGYKNSTVFRLVLTGSNRGLPSEIERIMKDQVLKKEGIDLSLSMNLPVRMKISLVKTWSMTMVVVCDLRVNTLAKGTLILSQACHTMVEL